MNKYNEQIEIINTILDDSNSLELYIEDIEKSNIKSPAGLKKDILQYINTNNKSNVKNSNAKIVKPLDILKIAACTILSLLLWQAMPLTTENINSKTNIKSEKPIYFLLNTNDFYKKINQFMFKPIEIERREN